MTSFATSLILKLFFIMFVANSARSNDFADKTNERGNFECDPVTKVSLQNGSASGIQVKISEGERKVNIYYGMKESEENESFLGFSLITMKYQKKAFASD